MEPVIKESSAHLLIVDDDREIRDLVSRFLRNHGFRATVAKDGSEMKRALADWRIDLIVLDLMLPGDDGLTLCRDLRASSKIPIIMLTAMGEDTDRIVGLEMGADDYLAKPFNPRELLARIKAVLRRAGEEPARAEKPEDKVFRFAGWKLDPGRRRLESPQRVVVELSAGEHDLLLALVEHPQRVLSRDQLLDMTRGRAAVPFDRSVDVQVGRLRRKIEADPKSPELIKTVRGGGYLLAVPVERKCDD
jgi:two-component system OmpR family response regulator